MYKSHRNLLIPSNSRQRLWRYFKYERLVELLSCEAMYFRRLSRLEDKLEGQLSDKAKNKLFKHALRLHNGDAQSAHAFVKNYEEHRESFYINCWCMNDIESYLMWKAYGDKGVAIQTNFERIQSSFDVFNGEINGGVVDYINFERDEFDPGNVFNPAVKKDLPYRDEREFRLLFWQLHPLNQEILAGPDGIKVKVNLNMLIDNIYINPQLTELESSIQELVRQKKLECDIRSSALRIQPA